MINQALLALGGLYVAAHLYKAQGLRHFEPSEFGAWFPLVDKRLLRALDDYRDLVGVPVNISPAPGAVGRIGTDNDSRHDLAKWGQVQAVDVTVPGLPLREAYRIADESGLFGGVGVYPDWQPRPGLHLDIRPDRARWSARLVSGKQEYFGIDRAWA